MKKLKDEMDSSTTLITASETPNLVADVLTHVKELVDVVMQKPDEAVTGVLQKLTLDQLAKIHDTTTSGNLDWKIQQLCKIIFDKDMVNYSSMASKTESCKSLMVNAISFAFMSEFMNEDGVYDHKGYSSTIMKTMVAKAKGSM